MGSIETGNQQPFTLTIREVPQTPPPTRAEKLAEHAAEQRAERQQVGILLRAARSRAGMTQAALATALNYTPQQVSRWERGTRSVPMRLMPEILDTLQTALFVRRETRQVLREIAARGSEEW